MVCGYLDDNRGEGLLEQGLLAASAAAASTALSIGDSPGGTRFPSTPRRAKRPPDNSRGVSQKASFTHNQREGDGTVKKLMIRFLRDDKGEDLIEYGLLAAFVATVATAVIIGNPGIRIALTGAFNRAAAALNAMQ